MRYPIHKEVRPLRDDQVDRAEVEVQQCMELTVTNRSQAYPNAEKEISKQSVGLKKSKKDLQLSDECSIILYVVLKARSRTIFDRCASPGEIGWLYMLSTVFLDSSMVEHSAVNRRVVGSSPTRGVLF